MHKDQRGFTLVELLVVVAVMGLMSAIIMVSMNSVRSKGRDARRVANLNQVYKALELYYSNYGVYPSNSGDAYSEWIYTIEDLQLAGLLSDAGADEDGFELVRTAQAFYPTAPKQYQDPLFNPAVGNYNIGYTYTYQSSSNPGAGYRMRTKLENLNHPALLNGLTGSFMDRNYTTGDFACDKSLGYYCIGAGSFTN